MEAVVPSRSYCHARIRITTVRPTEFIDITERLKELVNQSGVRFGVVNVHTLHTTATVVVNENEPLLLTDFGGLLERAAPAGVAYRHDNAAIRTVNVTPDERINGHAHCRALLLGHAISLNVIDGVLQLGRWQRAFLAEFDGPRPREISVLMLGEASR